MTKTEKQPRRSSFDPQFLVDDLERFYDVIPAMNQTSQRASR
jgi:hypothetical protein